MRANIAPAGGRAADLAQATPDARDRYVDFLRIASILVVVLGHWLMAVVVWGGHGIHVGNVLGMVPRLWLATWVLQVMPVFFFVGGFANLVTLDSLRRRGRGTSEYLAGRAQRLVRPVAVLLAVWVPVSLLASALGADPKVLGDATKVVCQPLWFIGVYLMVSALAPPMRDLHARHRARALVVLAALAIIVDIARFAGGIDVLAWANMLFVWLFAQQLGFFYADGTLAKWTRPALWAVAGAALTALIVLTTFGPYPHSMVGLPGERVSNMAPPTVCLLVLTVLQVAAGDARARCRVQVVAARTRLDCCCCRQRRHHDDLPLALERVARHRARALSHRVPAAGGRECAVVGDPTAVDRVRRDTARGIRRAARSLRTTAPGRVHGNLGARDLASRHRYRAARARDLRHRERHTARHRARKRSTRARRPVTVAGDGRRRRGLVAAPRIGARRDAPRP